MKIGVIGGSGIYDLPGLDIVGEKEVVTPFGAPSDPIVEMKWGENSFLFISRHGRDHRFLPHEVNYRANIFALKKMGVQYIVSASAVGSLKEGVGPGTFVLPDQFIDWTKGGRARTFFGGGVVGHVSTAYPVDSRLREMVAASCKKTNVNHVGRGTYLCIEGPQFSSVAESHLYRSFGASIIGMTGVPESYLAKEAGMAYVTMAMVTDFDCWKDGPCNVEAIMEVMKKNGKNVLRVLSDLIPKLASHPLEFPKDNRTGVMTPLERMTPEQSEIMDVLLK